MTTILSVIGCANTGGQQCRHPDHHRKMLTIAWFDFWKEPVQKSPFNGQRFYGKCTCLRRCWVSRVNASGFLPKSGCNCVRLTWSDGTINLAQSGSSGTPLINAFIFLKVSRSVILIGCAGQMNEARDHSDFCGISVLECQSRCDHREPENENCDAMCFFDLFISCCCGVCFLGLCRAKAQYSFHCD